MGIYIKGMKKPRNCHECVFGKYEVCAINISVEKKDTITHSCPLVEVPAHGDLIDRDSVLEILSDKNAAWDGYVKVKALPIVVESEDG